MIETIFHGHSFIEVSSENTTLLIDPFITGNLGCDLTIEDVLSKVITAIIVTHAHNDHLGQTVEIAKATGCMVICTYEVGEYLIEQGLECVETHSIGSKVPYEAGFEIAFTPALHGGGNRNLGIHGIAAGVILSLGGKTIYHAGDTGLTKEFELISEYEIDVAFLPIGGRFTMDIPQAVRSIPMLTPQWVVPIHYNTRKLIKQDPTEFATQVMQQGIAVPKVLKPGQMLVL